MNLLLIALVVYAFTILAAAVGFIGFARGGGRFMRIVFACSLAATFILIIAAGAAARHAM